jgi:hypothetical protein
LGIGGVADADVKAKNLILVYHVMLDAGEKARIDPSTGDVLVEQRGSGLELVVKVSEVKASFKLNLVTVAAAASVSLAQTALIVFLKGVPAEAQPLGHAPPLGALREKDGLKLVLDYVKTVKGYMADNPATLTANVNTVVRPKPAQTPLERALSVVFAHREIEDGRVLREALEHAEKNPSIDADIVRNGYQARLRLPGDEVKPSESQRKDADKWLHV